MIKTKAFLRTLRVADLRHTVYASIAVLILSGLTTAQTVAHAVPFTSASSSITTTIKIPDLTFLPLYATSKNPTTFYIDDETSVSQIILPIGAAFGGTKYDVPGVKGWTFPEAKSEIVILLNNNSTKDSKTITVFQWENVGPDKKPVLTGKLQLELLPKINVTPIVVPVTPVTPDVKPVPDDGKTKPVPDVTPVVYTGKWLLCVIEETQDATAQRGRFFQDKDLRDYLSTHLDAPPRVVDQDAKTAGGSFPKDLQPYLTLFKSSGMKLPYFFMVKPDGTILKQGTIDASAQPKDFLTVLKTISP